MEMTMKINPLLKRTGRVESAVKPTNKRNTGDLSLAVAISKLRDALVSNCSRMEDRIATIRSHKSEN